VSAALPEGYKLRALDEQDALELHALIEHNHARLSRWIHWAQGQTAADTLAFIGRARAKEQDGSGFSLLASDPSREALTERLGGASTA
jgi:hypothetical protein